MEKKMYVLLDGVGDPVKFYKFTQAEYFVIDDILCETGTDYELCSIEDLAYMEIKGEKYE